MSKKKDDVREGPAIEAAITARAKEVRANVSVAERLTTRARNQRETITIGEDPDAVEIEIRVPLACEVREIEELQRRVVQTGAEMRQLVQDLTDIGTNREMPDREIRRAEIAAALERLRDQADRDLHRHLELVADIIVDETVTADFLESGQLALEDVGIITQEILDVVRNRAAEARSFRRKRIRKGSVPDVPEVRETPP